jgi:hypothetical protein
MIRVFAVAVGKRWALFLLAVVQQRRLHLHALQFLSQHLGQSATLLLGFWGLC